MGNARNLADLLGTSTKANQVISTSGNISTTGDLTVDSGVLSVTASDNKIRYTQGTNKGLVIQDAGIADTTEVNFGTSGEGIRAGLITGSNLSFYTGTAGGGSASKAMEIDVSKNVTVTDGDLIVGTSGHGISFAATTDGSGANQAEILDDYEEGTWTPTLTNGGSVTINAATYTKIGNIMRVGTYLALSSIPNNSNAFYIGGLPYNVDYTAGGGNDHYHGAGSITYVGSHDIAGFGMLPPTPYTGQATMYFHRGDGTTSVVTNADVTGMSHIIVATSYKTA